MMIHYTPEEAKLHEDLRKTTDENEAKKIIKRLKEIAIQRQEELKDCPFCH